jgi:proteic killer suppression protein
VELIRLRREASVFVKTTPGQVGGQAVKYLAATRKIPCRLGNIQHLARRKLIILDAATELNTLRVPPGNRLEALKGDRKGQHSIRINEQWRICFRWKAGDAYDVEIADYH